MIPVRFSPILLLLLSLSAHAAGTPPLPFADAHIHYNWDQAEVTDPDEVIRRLQQGQVNLAVLASTPTALAQSLSTRAPWIIPLFSPYIKEDSRQNWYRDEEVLARAERDLAGGLYRGIGEVHFMAGFPPRPDNKIFRGLQDLARRHRLPMLIHVDAASESWFLGICEASADIRFVLAHAGGILKPAQVETLLRRCPNSMMDLSARDPWRYGGLLGADDRLLPEWDALIRKYPRRFLVGTDPVWRVTRTQGWDQPDEGWDHLQELLAWHRRWISTLPADIQQLLLQDNARRLWLGVPGN